MLNIEKHKCLNTEGFEGKPCHTCIAIVLIRTKELNAAEEKIKFLKGKIPYIDYVELRILLEQARK